MPDQQPTYLDEQGNPTHIYLDDNGEPIKSGLSPQTHSFLENHPTLKGILESISSFKPIDPIEGRSFHTASSLLPTMEHGKDEGWPEYLAKGAYNQFVEPLGSALGVMGLRGPKGLVNAPDILKGRLANIPNQIVEDLPLPKAQPQKLLTGRTSPQLALPSGQPQARPSFLAGPSGASGQVAPVNASPDLLAEIAGMGQGQPSRTGLGAAFDPAELREANRLAKLGFTEAEQYPGTRLSLPESGLQLPQESGSTLGGFSPQTKSPMKYPYNIIPNRLRPRAAQSEVLSRTELRSQDLTVPKVERASKTVEIVGETKSDVIRRNRALEPLEEKPDYYVGDLEDRIPELHSASKEKPFVSTYPKIQSQYSSEITPTIKPKIESNPINELRSRLQSVKTEGAIPEDIFQRAQPEQSIGRTTFNQVINTPKTIMSSVDLSAPLRQGLPLIYRKEWWSSLKPMLEAGASEKGFQELQTAIREMPTYSLMKGSKLALTEAGENLAKNEEAFLSSWVEKVPGIGRIIRASDRSYTMFLNKLRADTFDSLIKDAVKLGHDPADIGPKIAKFVNVSTGRGSLGMLEKNAVELNAVFFSPRLISSRLTMLNPKYYVDQPEPLRKEALKALFATAGAGLTFAGLGKLAGAELEGNITNSDFGKVKVGNTRIDPYGGFQQYIVAAGKLIKGESTSSVSGKTTELGIGYRAPTRRDVLLNFGENKLSPVASFIDTILKGKDFAGKPVSYPKEIANRFTPMFIGDLMDLAEEDPKLLPLGITGLFGMGLQSYK
jgi:hypothetical protein